MINEGISLEGLAMPSSGAAAGTRSAMPARSTSTTTGRATSGTTSASVDPRNSRLNAGHGHVRLTLGREIPGETSPKAWQHAQPGTVAVAPAAVTEHGKTLHCVLCGKNFRVGSETACGGLYNGEPLCSRASIERDLEKLRDGAAP